MKNRENSLKIGSEFTENGFCLTVCDQEYHVRYPAGIWEETPKDVREAIRDHIVFGFTNVVPLITGATEIEYTTKQPLFADTLFRHQLYDMFKCELADNVEMFTYFRHFFNLKIGYSNKDSLIPKDYSSLRKEKKAVIPFSFGKESLVTFCLCRELGIEPILVYCQEPSYPFEEKHKVRKLKEYEEKFGVHTGFIHCDPGLFRHDCALRLKPLTELGWGTQVNLAGILAIPFAFKFKAGYMFVGNEATCEKCSDHSGWKMIPQYGQTKNAIFQFRNMIRILSGQLCSLFSSLEPVEEIAIFNMLNRRYPEVASDQFSCEPLLPLVKDSQWCHNCYKCERFFLYARACGIDPLSIGFKYNLFEEPNRFSNYFGNEFKCGSREEMTLAFHLLARKGDRSPYTEMFKNEKLPLLNGFESYADRYSTLQSSCNLPPLYREKMLSIFREELEHLKNKFNS